MQGPLRPSDLEDQKYLQELLRQRAQRINPPMAGYCPPDPPRWRQALPWVLFGAFAGWVIAAGAYMMWITYQ